MSLFKVITHYSSFQDYDDVKALKLIRWTIIVDTVNLSQEAQKVTDLDVQILQKIEAKLNVSADDRFVKYHQFNIKLDWNDHKITHFCPINLSYFVDIQLTASKQKHVIIKSQNYDESGYIPSTKFFIL